MQKWYVPNSNLVKLETRQSGKRQIGTRGVTKLARAKVKRAKVASNLKSYNMTESRNNVHAVILLTYCRGWNLQLHR